MPVSIMAGYWRSVPSRAGTVRPNRHRVPVRRFTPTTRDATALLTPREVNRPYFCRCRVNGDGPGTFVLPLLPSMTTSTPLVLRRSLDSKASQWGHGLVILQVTDADIDRLIRNVYKVLLTRGTLGVDIYSTDRETRQFIARLL
jgi:hypothetical protein